LLIDGIDHMIRRSWVNTHAAGARSKPDACRPIRTFGAKPKPSRTGVKLVKEGHP